MDDHTKNQADKSFSFLLNNAAKSGKFNTLFRPSAQTPPAQNTTDSKAVQAETKAEREAQNTPSYSTAQQERVRLVAMSTQDQESLAPDRTEINSENFVTASFARKDLLITASAAKSLTKLFSALAIEPGSGNEVPLAIREKVLSTLIKESHLLADRLSRAATPEGNNVSIYLRAKVLQQAAEFISDKWVREGVINTDNLYETARAAFSGEVEGLSQEVVDLFHQAGEYTPASTDEIAQARITESVIRASWRMFSTIQGFDLADYDEALIDDKGRAGHPYSYGREAHDVARDLTNIVLGIARENRLDVSHLDLATTWQQNAIDRATSLVCAEYRLHTDRALRASFLNEMTSEPALHSVSKLYDAFLARIQKRARNSFILIEKNALDVMSANAYKHYVPKVLSHRESAREATSHQAQTVVLDKNYAQPAVHSKPSDPPATHTAYLKPAGVVLAFPEVNKNETSGKPDLSEHAIDPIDHATPVHAQPSARPRFSFGAN